MMSEANQKVIGGHRAVVHLRHMHPACPVYHRKRDPIEVAARLAVTGVFIMRVGGVEEGCLVRV
jgi:hypothetical protein